MATDMRESITKQTGFALRLARHAGGSSPAAAKNLVLSPVSLHAVLGLVSAGSRGATQDQVLKIVGADAADELHALASQTAAVLLADASAAGGPRIAFANGVWVDASLKLKPVFGEIVVKDYKAEAKPVDFQSKADEVRNDVNSWVENVTSNLIKDLLPAGSVDKSTKLIFANGLYFKGSWDKKFDSSQTKNADFYLLNGSSKQVPFMTSKDKQFLSAQDGFKVLGLPYKQGQDNRRFSMYIFLPDSREGLPNLVEKLTSDFGSLERFLPKRKVPVGKFKIPKFKIEFGLEVSDVLKGLGLVLPFSRDADLSDMVDSAVIAESLYVSKIFHKSFIEVNEEGTEAAAASAAVILTRSLVMDEPEDFEADHPFFYLIREDMTGIVMFAGQVIDP